MKIIGFEKLSLVDYDGYASATLFCGGCNFRCPFCHNGELVLNSNLYDEYKEKEIFTYLKKRVGLLDGVVISGGEPTLYADLPIFISKLKELGYKVKLDTNGTNPEMLKYLIENKLLDYIAMDIKSSKRGYPRAIGRDYFPEEVQKSLDILKDNQIDYELRTTLVEELISREDIIAMRSWLKGCKKLFLQRFIERDGCIRKGLQEVEYQKALEYRGLFEEYSIPCFLRNYD